MTLYKGVEPVMNVVGRSPRITGEERSPKRRGRSFDLVVPTLAALYFATGAFGFLNIFGIRRQFQWILAVSLALTLPRVLSGIGRWIREPLWWMSAALVVGQLVLRTESSGFAIFDRVVALYVVSLVFSLSEETVRTILKAIIVLAATFSVMVLIQAFFIKLLPGVLSSFAGAFSSEMEARVIKLGHPLEYLGFVTRDVPGFAGLPRLQSFASEPSVLICSFLAPAIMSLGFTGRVRKAGIPIILFVVVLAQSGTVVACLFLGFASFGALRLLRSRRAWAVLPFAVLAIAYVLLSQVDVGVLTSRVGARISLLAAHTRSGTIRLTDISLHFQNRGQYLLGSPDDPGLPVGMALHMMLAAGLPGVFLTFLAVGRILRRAAHTFHTGNRNQRIMAAFASGMLFQAMSFSEYGWMNSAGFLMLALMTRHFAPDAAEDEAPSARVAKRSTSRRHRFVSADRLPERLRYLYPPAELQRR